MEKQTGPPTTTRVGIAGGPASVADETALAPWLCVTAFRRLCSEQRARAETKTTGPREAVTQIMLQRGAMATPRTAPETGWPGLSATRRPERRIGRPAQL